MTQEQIRIASGHTTNKGFERYYTLSPDDLRKTYSLTRRQQGGKEFSGRKVDLNVCNYNMNMVGGGGFEPPTSTV